MENLFSEKLKCVFNKPGVYYIKGNNQNYVGSSIGLADRLLEHRQKLNSNKHECKWMQNIFNKYGKEKFMFSILEVLDTEDISEIRQCEKKWIDLLGPTLNTELDPTTQNNCITTSKQVYQYTLEGKLINIYPSTREASRKTGINATMIASCARGIIFSAKGFYWSYTQIAEYNYGVQRSKWKWRPVQMTEISTGKVSIFENIAKAARSIYKDEDNFDSMCASISAIAGGKGKTLWNKYTFTYI